MGVLGDHRVEGFEDLADRLVELDLAAVARHDLFVDLLNDFLHGVLLTTLLVWREARVVGQSGHPAHYGVSHSTGN